MEDDTIFKKNWQTYRVVLRENYNRHTQLYATVPTYIETRFPNQFSILDLGCGDVDYFSKALANNDIWSRVLSYTGVDLSVQAMEIGETNVRKVVSSSTPVSFVVCDMLDFVKRVPDATYDLVFSSIAIHHLQDTEKEALVNEIRRILRLNGALIVIDIFLEEDEDRDHFIKEFNADIRHNWTSLTDEQTENLINHISNFDFPAKLSDYTNWACASSNYKSVECLKKIRFCRTIVLEVD
ncbi:unnamed protein product [Rotaria magnacalcarata]|nr:unnamed protein product [Rotaria magnacalcarata]CAF4394065.1 unnamed protein product [Rotaria magnacalcarata]